MKSYLSTLTAEREQSIPSHPTISRCTRCGLVKPLTDFYIRKDGRPDCLCKACRKAASKNRYDRRLTEQVIQQAQGRCNIFLIPDRAERIRLLVHAKEQVLQSILSKRKKAIEADFSLDEGMGYEQAN